MARTLRVSSAGGRNRNGNPLPLLRQRPAAFGRLRADHGQSTTEWLMIAGILTAIGIFLLGIVPNGLATFMRSMAASLRTIAP